VESAGFEPASKQAIQKPSTSLVFDWFSNECWPKTVYKHLSIFIEKHRWCICVSMLTFMVPQYRSPSTRAIQRHPAFWPSQNLAL